MPINEELGDEIWNITFTAFTNRSAGSHSMQEFHFHERCYTKGKRQLITQLTPRNFPVGARLKFDERDEEVKELDTHSAVYYPTLYRKIQNPFKGSNISYGILFLWATFMIAGEQLAGEKYRIQGLVAGLLAGIVPILVKGKIGDILGDMIGGVIFGGIIGWCDQDPRIGNSIQSTIIGALLVGGIVLIYKIGTRVIKNFTKQTQ